MNLKYIKFVIFLITKSHKAQKIHLSCYNALNLQNEAFLMDGLEYRDPLFGIIVFTALIFIVTFFNYWWGLFKRREQNLNLGRFLRQYELHSDHKHLGTLLHTTSIPAKSLQLLASAYYGSGDFEKSIDIYRTLLQRPESPQERKHILLQLGKTYFKAGFMQRAKETLMQLLKLYPRTPEALMHLMIIHERLKSYDKAHEVLESLQMQQSNLQKDALFLLLMKAIYSKSSSNEEKIVEIVRLYTHHNRFHRLVIGFLFRTNNKSAWEYINEDIAINLSDILWNLRESQLNFDIISSIPYLCELYAAKGYETGATQSDVFELNVLIGLKNSDNCSADLQFEYLCDECKHVFPFSFHRCPNCLHVDTLRCELILSRGEYEEDYALQ